MLAPQPAQKQFLKNVDSFFWSIALWVTGHIRVIKHKSWIVFFIQPVYLPLES